jgi:hypothetical protein
MNDRDFEGQLPDDLRRVADRLSANGSTPDVHLLDRVQRRVQAQRPAARPRLSYARVLTGALLAAVGFAATSLSHLNLAQAVTALVSSTSTSTQGSASADVYCPEGTKASFRWHYAGMNSNGTFTSGSWSGTQGVTCPDTGVSMGPQAMEGDLKVAPGTTLKAGYDLTVPGYTSPVTINVTNPKVEFDNVHCASGATPTQSSFTVTMPNASYQITSTAWYPSGDQASPLVYEGSILVPNLCPGGTDHRVRLDKGGTFTASVN